MAKKNAEPRIVRHPASVALSKDELVDRADELSKLIEERTTLEDTAREVAKEHREQLKKMRERIEDLGDVVRSRKEIREVECKEVPDFDKEVVELFRLDTGERVHARQLTEEDRQMRI